MSGEPATAQQLFSQTAATYDVQRACLVPGYAELYASVLRLLPAGMTSCVDLGTGTGLLAACVRSAHPGAGLLLVDNSEPMLAQARQRFLGDGRVEFRCADYTRTVLPDNVEAVVSALSIHHLSAADKRRLFKQVAASLRPGGVFINADQVLGSDAALEAGLRADWLQEVRSLGATEAQIADSLLRQEADRCDTVADQLRWMAECFTGVDCWYRRGRFAVMYGYKAGD